MLLSLHRSLLRFLDRKKNNRISHEASWSHLFSWMKNNTPDGFFFESTLRIDKIISKLMVKSWYMKNYDFPVPKDVFRLLQNVSSNII